LIELRIQSESQGAGERLDRALVLALPQLTRGMARRLIDEGRVFVDGKRCRVASRILREGARLIVHLEEPKEAAGGAALPTRDPRAGPDRLGSRGGAALPTRDPRPGAAFQIIHEDERMIAIDKRPGETVNETETSAELSVVERLAAKDAYTVHRIDRETSGVVVLAKGKRAAEALSAAFRDRRTEKTYLAIVKGRIADQLIDEPIGTDRRRPRARWIDPRGKPAQTRIVTLSSSPEVSAVEARPITGRTHQIRVHLAHAGAPIVGDLTYGGPMKVRVHETEIEARRVLLHARRLMIEGIVLEAAIPDDMLDFARAGLALGSGPE
jgi:23S rRNA pseudouridine1911/1915/1917 synthase